jgi:hypothetical protein
MVTGETYSLFTVCLHTLRLGCSTVTGSLLFDCCHLNTGFEQLNPQSVLRPDNAMLNLLSSNDQTKDFEAL